MRKNIFPLTSLLASFLYNKLSKVQQMEYFLRIDKFLNAVNLTKRRTIAQDMIGEDVVLLNGKAVKPAKNVAIGDIITLVYLAKTLRYEVLAIPTLKSTPKSQQNLYVKELV